MSSYLDSSDSVSSKDLDIWRKKKEKEKDNVRWVNVYANKKKSQYFQSRELGDILKRELGIFIVTAWWWFL